MFSLSFLNHLLLRPFQPFWPPSVIPLAIPDLLSPPCTIDHSWNSLFPRKFAAQPLSFFLIGWYLDNLPPLARVPCKAILDLYNHGRYLYTLLAVLSCRNFGRTTVDRAVDQNFLLLPLDTVEELAFSLLLWLCKAIVNFLYHYLTLQPSSEDTTLPVLLLAAFSFWINSQ